jgi:hypothetical protein
MLAVSRSCGKASNLTSQILDVMGGSMKSRPPPKLIGGSQRQRPRTFADIRRNAEERLKLGLDLDFDKIMADIAALRAGHRISIHN